MATSNLRGISIKPLAAALAIALGAASLTAAAGTSTGSAFAAHMQALHNAVAQLKQYRAEHPGKLALFPNGHPHKIKFPRNRHAPAAVTATVAVTSCVDNAASATTPGTLRYAALNAAAGDTIDLSACNASTITLSQGALPVSVDNLTITAGAGNHVTLDGAGTDRVIYDQAPGTTSPSVLALRYLTLQNGKSPLLGSPAYAAGGCILAGNIGVAMYYSTVTGCSADNPTGPAEGGGIAAASLYMYQSSISGNSVSTGTGAPPTGTGAPPIALGGGAVAKYQPYIVNSHIDGNTAASAMGVAASGGGLVAQAPYIVGSTISNNIVQVSVGSATGTTNLGIGGGLTSKYGGTLQASTISGNRLTCTSMSTTTPNAVCFGAGVATAYNSGGGSGSQLGIYYSTISGNSSACPGAGTFCLGGGVHSKYGLNVAQSTISGNSAQVGAGVLQKYLGGRGSYVYNSTIASNNAVYAGGGVYAYVGGPSGTVVPPITLASSIVATNTAGYSGGDVYLPNAYTLTISGSNDLVMDASSNITLPGGTLNADPMLAPLANNGGPTQTMGLLAGSPALDAGSNPNAYTNDQRGTGFPRVVGANPDIGAFEGTVVLAVPVPAPALSAWALVLLAGLLGFFGWRRRRTE